MLLRWAGVNRLALTWILMFEYEIQWICFGFVAFRVEKLNNNYCCILLYKILEKNPFKYIHYPVYC